jgi:prepilin-type N-terminal cleavage/methylation domain-containing protein
MRKGFTMIELLVAVGLFAIVTSIAMGGFANALRTQRQSAGLIGANSNVSLVLEQISREIRTGYDFCVNGQNCPSLGELSFKNAKKQVVTYCLDQGGIMRGTGPGGCGAAGIQKITADNVLVQHLEFYLDGNRPGDGRQPRITIAIGVSSKESGISGNVINLQTTLSPRLPLDT